MRGKPKIGDDVDFLFAGCPERGIVTEIEDGLYTVYDGKYYYPVHIENVTKKHKKK